MRADVAVVDRGLAPTRAAAARLIERKALRICTNDAWRTVTKAGERVAEHDALEVADDAELHWASRGGLKLEGALERTAIDVAGAACLDVGQSTGGFTDVLLARGAARVVGIDVGHGQLDPRLRGDARVVAIEGVNARHLVRALLPASRFDLIVADVSFISLTLVMPALAALDADQWLLLVKPQFELRPADIGKGGIVRDPASHATVERRLRQAAVTYGFVALDWFDSATLGGDGNREFLLHARRGAAIA